MSLKSLSLIGLALVLGISASPCLGQLGRRVDRNARQLDRQAARMANRADYYAPEVWTQVNPWIQQYQIAPLQPLRQAAGRAVDRAADLATDAGRAAVNRALYGYNPANRSANGWFYDYYYYWPSHYVFQDATASDYSTAIRYFDADLDGVYEVASTYRDSDRDGTFDQFDRYDFSTFENDVEFEGSPADARRYKFSGRILATKSAKVNDQEYLIVQLATDQDSKLVVDLGPRQEVENLGLDASDSLTVVGSLERIGDSDVLIAETVTVKEQTVQIDRPLPSIRGTVLDVKTIKIRDADHLLVVVQTEGGNQLVDLGPRTALKVNVQPEARLVIQGVPVRSHDHRVVMATRVELNGQTHTIARWK